MWRGGEHSQRAALSSCHHVEPLGSRVQSHPRVQLQERRLAYKLRLTTGTHNTHCRVLTSKHKEESRCCGRPTWRSCHYIHIETHILSHGANLLGITGTLSRRSVGHLGETAEVPPRLWRLLRNLCRDRVMESLPTIPLEVTESKEENNTAKVQSRSRQQQLLNVHTEQNSSSTAVALLTGSTSRNSSGGNVSVWGISPAGEALGCIMSWVCRVKIKKENQYPGKKTTGLAL